MAEDEIVSALRTKQGRLSAVGLAELIDQLTGGKLSYPIFVTVFHRAFPLIPLRVLLDSGAWHRLTGGDLSDEEFNDLLSPWLQSGPTEP